MRLPRSDGRKLIITPEGNAAAEARGSWDVGKAIQGTAACGSYFSEPRVSPFTMKRWPTNMRTSAGMVASTEADAISPCRTPRTSSAGDRSSRGPRSNGSDRSPDACRRAARAAAPGTSCRRARAADSCDGEVQAAGVQVPARRHAGRLPTSWLSNVTAFLAKWSKLGVASHVPP